MKILLSEQIRQVDSATIASEPISSLDLMKRAGRAAYLRLKKLLPENPKVLILCGTGNNGGDGLVIAREFERDRIKVETRVFRLGRMSLDCKSVSEEANWEYIDKPEDISHLLHDRTIVIDCLLGSGQDRPISGGLERLISFLNKCSNPVISIDIPTGLRTDGQNGDDLILSARHTISLQLPKLGFMMPPHGAATQSFEMVDIGLDQNYIDSLQSPFSFILEEDIRPLLGRRDTFSHKGDYGHVLLVAGSDNMTGAAVLAAHAGLRSGCGKMTVASTAMVHSAIQSTLPECMVRSRDSISKVDVEKNTLVVGPGLGRGEKVKELLMDLFDKRSTPCVIDADALYSIGASLEMIKLVPKESILTPHPGEFKLLTGKEFSGRDGFDIGRSYAEEHSVYLLVKGAYTALFCPDGKVCFNSTGNPSMAKGGSGDVLTGMIGAFLAQDHSAKESALIAMFLHGAAGDLAARNESPISVLASDLIENIGSAFNQTAGLTPGEKD